MTLAHYVLWQLERWIIMLTLFGILTPLLSAEPLASDHGSDFGVMLLRIGLFLIFLLVFVFACGYAWRTLPALRAILPLPEKRVTEQVKLNLPPLAGSDQILDVYSYTSENTASNGFAPSNEVSDPLAQAVVNGQPGSVIKAASDLDGPLPDTILIVQRRDNPQN